MIAKPSLGRRVRVTTDWSELLKLHTCNVPRRSTTEGTVVEPEPWDAVDTFRMTTGNPRFPQCTVPMDRVVALTYLDGETVRETAPQAKKEFVVHGSKGNVYSVFNMGAQWTCTCPGFKFYGHCKHIDRLRSEHDADKK